MVLNYLFKLNLFMNWFLVSQIFVLWSLQVGRPLSTLRAPSPRKTGRRKGGNCVDNAVEISFMVRTGDSPWTRTTKEICPGSGDKRWGEEKIEALPPPNKSLITQRLNRVETGGFAGREKPEHNAHSRRKHKRHRHHAPIRRKGNGHDA